MDIHVNKSEKRRNKLSVETKPLVSRKRRGQKSKPMAWVDAWQVATCYLQDHAESLPVDVVLHLIGPVQDRDVAGTLSALQECASALTQDAESMRFYLQMKAFFSKNADFSDDVACTKTAVETFYSFERQCRTTNERLSRYYRGYYRYPNQLHRWVTRMQDCISRVMGSVEDFLDQVPNLVKVTSGATENLSREQARPYLKIRTALRHTPGSLPFIHAYAKWIGVDIADLRLTATECNRVELVPKNWKTKRVIACETTGTLPFQLAADAWTKDGLLRELGIDLRHGQKLNIAAAKAASITGTRATVDFSSASDSTALAAVCLLYPAAWWDLLSRLNAKKFFGVDVGEGTYEKFSSMGNGVTFTMESLIFSAAAYAVGSRDFLVYGDDVIIETECYKDFSRLCRWLGYTVNPDKTFTTGSFRESCGGDFYDGIRVTPFYMRTNLNAWLDDRGSLKVNRRKLAHTINGLAAISKPGGRLESFLLEACAPFVRRGVIPVVPYNEDTGSGVFVHRSEVNAFPYVHKMVEGPDRLTRKARATKKRMMHEKGTCYVPLLVESAVVDHVGRSRKALFLWHLQKSVEPQPEVGQGVSLREVALTGPKRACITSTTVSDVKVRVRLSWSVVSYHGPVPTHLYWWGERLLASL